MLDPQLLRNELEQTAEKLAARGYQLDVAEWQALEQSRKAVQLETEALQNKRTTISKSIGQAKGRGEDVQPLLDEVAAIGEALDQSKDSK